MTRGGYRIFQKGGGVGRGGGGALQARYEKRRGDGGGGVLSASGPMVYTMVVAILKISNYIHIYNGSTIHVLTCIRT